MPHEPFVRCIISVQMSTLLAVNDIARVVMPGTGSDTYSIESCSVSARALVSGTATVVVLNGAGTSIFSIPMSGTAPITSSSSSPGVSTIAGGDMFRIGFSGIGVGLQDVSVNIVVKMPSVA